MGHRILANAVMVASLAVVLQACDTSGKATKKNENGQEATRAAGDVPQRRPGLWRQTIFVENAGEIRSMRLCLDAETDKVIAWWGQSGLRRQCSENSIKKVSDNRWSFSSQCEAEGGVKTIATGDVVGNFNDSYQLKSVITVTNSPIAQLAGTRTVQIDAKWEGECPATLSPGDAVLETGEVISLLGQRDRSSK